MFGFSLHLSGDTEEEWRGTQNTFFYGAAWVSSQFTALPGWMRSLTPGVGTPAEPLLGQGRLAEILFGSPLQIHSYWLHSQNSKSAQAQHSTAHPDVSMWFKASKSAVCQLQH
ncbi:hypothetical protein GN956_G20585 [Arapaima gigas]